ncbi:MAG TPA: hypothetical protein VJW73_20595 [Gemmatimonadaceae bacterium]|nr:hypothetical protein [Gemmatimonadaceae bacterium]
MINASLLLGVFVLPALGPARLPVHWRTDPVVRVVATDYRLTLPTSLHAGPTTFRLENHGRELHQLYLARLTAGKSAADLVTAIKAGGPPPSWAVDVGGPNGVDPGSTAFDVTVQLTPGHYAALCIIPSADGVPHVMKGMYADVTVVPGSQQTSLPRSPDVTVTLQDYGYATSTPLTAGYHRLLVRNEGKQSHELELARLAPGKSPGDIPRWIEKMQGPPPASFLGGVSPLAPGQQNELSLTLTPGHYVMLCFIPDARDGKPHIAHGMIHDFVVR